MKDPYEVLRSKELEVAAVRQQVEALRIAARLLDDEEPPKQTESKSQPGPVQVMK
jgi:hypothetical protein